MFKSLLLKMKPDMGALKASVINGILMMIPTIAVQILNQYVINQEEISGTWFFWSVVLTIVVCLMWNIGDTVTAITSTVGKLFNMVGKMFLVIPGIAGVALCICVQITGWFVFVMFLYLIPVVIMPILGFYRFIFKRD